MGTRPNAHLWLGFPATNDSPFNEWYNGEENPNVLEAWEWNRDNKEKFGVAVVQIADCGDGPRFALALEHHETDWDDDLALQLRSHATTTEEVERLRAAAEALGWRQEGSVMWRLAVTYPI